MFNHHAVENGIHLSAFISDASSITQILIGVMLTVVVSFIVYWMYYKKNRSLIHETYNFYIINVLFLWSLLVAYHREHDTLMYILFIGLVIKYYTLEIRQQKSNIVILVTLFLLASLVVLTRSGSISLVLVVLFFIYLFYTIFSLNVFAITKQKLLFMTFVLSIITTMCFVIWWNIGDLLRRVVSFDNISQISSLINNLFDRVVTIILLGSILATITMFHQYVAKNA